MLIGFDFPFGYPRGFARALTGRADPFAVWTYLAGQIEDAVAKGARVLCGGRRLEREGFFLEPTVLADVTPTLMALTGVTPAEGMTGNDLLEA